MATKTLSLRIDEELIERIDALVGEGKSRNAVIKELIERGLATQEGEKTPEEIQEELMAKLIENASATITEQVTQDVVQKMREENNELFRDWSNQLASTILPPLITAGNKELSEVIVEELRPALPDPQAQVEGSETAPVAAETEPEPEKKSWWQRLFG